MLSLVTVSPVITAFHSCCLSHHVKKARGEIWPKRSEKKQQQQKEKTTRMRTKKSAINKKSNSLIKRPHLKRIHKLNSVWTIEH